VATRYDVAKEADVSEATVSHVINNTKYVSPELRQRVEKAIKLHNYRPNIVAKSLASKSTKHVGIFVDSIMNPYYGEIAHGMEEVAHKHGYIVSLFSAVGNSEEHFSSVIQRQLDGLLMATTWNPFSLSQVKFLHDNGVIFINSRFEIGSSLRFEYEYAIDSMAKYLSALGHKRVGFLSGLSIKTPDHIRYELFLSSIKKYGLDMDIELIIDGEYPYETSYDAGYEAMKKLLLVPRVTAVFCTNDLIAYGAYRAINETGLNIPKDISVIGCDDVFLSQCIYPPLTTIRVPTKEMGRQAMNLILNEIHEKQSANVKLKTNLVVRESAGPVGAGKK
jgi:DNA-binding LacI/PurR family transcriptional regulator